MWSVVDQKLDAPETVRRQRAFRRIQRLHRGSPKPATSCDIRLDGKTQIWSENIQWTQAAAFYWDRAGAREA